ncbi:hypothetical protein C4D60_Mb04t09300 [Musa balbisiana]|uniref:RING-type E3 ubiquitin transferase n=1 Tax=Musa balbisiana TaxID=52838 RepID=A0A4S8KAQ7_MUSBA|nr:hypothetical protein C4D60_Mb04t09300 [Musa balbisiana]
MLEGWKLMNLSEMIDNMQEIGGSMDLDSCIEPSMQVIGGGPQRPPPASKEVVANLPAVTVTEEIIARLGSETECAVCRENLAVDDKMQELPCKHLFHPPCLKPWLDEHNSCPYADMSYVRMIMHTRAGRREKRRSKCSSWG